LPAGIADASDRILFAECPVAACTKTHALADDDNLLLAVHKGLFKVLPGALSDSRIAIQPGDL
jgi:hypothetical protein